MVDRKDSVVGRAGSMIGRAGAVVGIADFMVDRAGSLVLRQTQWSIGKTPLHGGQAGFTEERTSACLHA